MASKINFRKKTNKKYPNKQQYLQNVTNKNNKNIKINQCHKNTQMTWSTNMKMSKISNKANNFNNKWTSNNNTIKIPITISNKIARRNNNNSKTKKKSKISNKLGWNNNNKFKCNKKITNMTWSKRHKCSSSFNNRGLLCPVLITKGNTCRKLLLLVSNKLILWASILLVVVMGNKVVESKRLQHRFCWTNKKDNQLIL